MRWVVNDIVIRITLESILESVDDIYDIYGEVVSIIDGKNRTNSRGYKDHGGGLVKVNTLYLWDVIDTIVREIVVYVFCKFIYGWGLAKMHHSCHIVRKQGTWSGHLRTYTKMVGPTGAVVERTSWWRIDGYKMG